MSSLLLVAILKNPFGGRDEDDWLTFFTRKLLKPRPHLFTAVLFSLKTLPWPHQNYSVQRIANSTPNLGSKRPVLSLDSLFEEEGDTFKNITVAAGDHATENNETYIS